MSNGPLRLLAGAGAGDDPIYVDDVFSTHLWTGDSSGSRSINNGIDLDGVGGLVWLKGRTQAYDHALYDTVRGATKEMYSNKTDLSSTNSNALTSFNSNGFSIGSGPIVNNNADTYVSWSFRKAENFFDVVAWSGTDGGGDKTLSHSLGSKPAVMIVKRYGGGGSDNWSFYHKDLFGGEIDGSGTGMYLNSTAAAFSMNNEVKSVSTTDFTVGTTHNGHSSYSYIAYLFAHNDGDGEYGEDGDEDIIKCGSYTGNGSSGQFINLGFEPQFLLIKSASSSHDWYLADAMRGMANTAVSTAHRYLYAQSAQAEEGYEPRWRTEPNGFHLTTAATGVNGSSNTYIYMAIARSHKPASEFAATDLFVVDESDTTGEPKYRSTFPVDLSFDKWATQGGSDTHVSARLLQGRYVRTNSDAAAADEASYQFDYATGFHSGSGATSGAYAWMFRRAKGFMDVVTYVGDGSSYSYAHNLGVTPELKIIKIRSDSFGGVVGGSALTGGTVDYMLMLNSDAAKANTNYWSAVDSSTQFSVKHSNYISNASGQTYIALLFATVAGISKVGTYTGTGSDLNIDCGFSAGARLVLIKRTDGTGDWYLWDSVRGIVAGNDYYILLNTTDAQNSSYDYIDPLSSGFTVTSSANYDLNTNGGEYLFLAIA